MSSERALERSCPDGGPGRPGYGAPRLVLLGFGGVGRSLARRLLASSSREGSPLFSVVAIADSRHTWIDPRGVDLRRALERKETGKPLGPRGSSPELFVDLLAEVCPDVVVEMTPSDPLHGEPGSTHLLAALRAGADVVTSNKGPLALRFAEVRDAARRYHREVRFGTTVGGIVPILELLVERLPPGEVVRIEGTLNGTTQFLLCRMSEGASFTAAMEEARGRGLTERDPRLDLEGWDAALKASILHDCAFASSLSPSDVVREPLGPEVEAEVERARRRGEVLVAVTTIEEDHAEVRLRSVPRGDAWAGPGGVSTFRVETRTAGTLLLQGRGAGPEETAAGVYADLCSLRIVERARVAPSPGWARTERPPRPAFLGSPIPPLPLWGLGRAANGREDP